MSATISNASPRIPAWKRLGLKLKSAADTPAQEVTVAASTTTHDTPKRKRLDEAEGTAHPKKKKASQNTLNLSAANQDAPGLIRKKSVTFTPETKASDGDSIKQLYNAWVADQNPQELSGQPAFNTPEPTKVEEEFDSTLDEKARRTKRVKPTASKSNASLAVESNQAINTRDTKAESKPKKKKAPKKSKSIVVPQTRPFLSYLKQYTENRDSWKFNKNHQNHLIKHLFDLDSIPSEYEAFIYPYVRGLQGGVRTRLRGSALAIKVKDLEEGAAGFPETMAERTKRQEKYDVAMKEYVTTMMSAEVPSNVGYEEGVLMNLTEKDPAMARRVLKRMRSERVLAELGVASEGEQTNGTSKEVIVIDDDEGQKRAKVNDGSSLARKRKQRTTVVDDSDTSSSDSSGDSDSSSGDDDETTTTTTRTENADDTSSSSSSSSSSGSDTSDSEEDSDDSESSESD
ncbi:hypothetical protein HYALB_00002950 [Hymenoscyphus albidus]|uniref:WKF domain-containing protein n=1 Tax=Hymenoscyphus albidus TaxID=595503 RepID=A0A9N9M060_9HELO|nr:hypothetical protein HYALB_00002950 [Hymenoscyphus albidus]